MIYYSAALFVGFLALLTSADPFVIASVASSRNFKISPMIIGLMVVALGTSAPEFFVSAISAIQDQTELAVGNAIGSNIANIGMVPGRTTIVVPLKFRVGLRRFRIADQRLLLMLGLTMLLVLFAYPSKTGWEYNACKVHFFLASGSVIGYFFITQLPATAFWSSWHTSPALIKRTRLMR